MNDIEKPLREDIQANLKLVTKHNSPWVWEQIQTKAGYSAIEDLIVNMVIDTGLVPAAIIPQLESENS